MTWMLSRVSAPAAATLATLAGLEVLPRVLPAYGGAYRTPVDDRRPVRRFTPDREFTWSRDWNFSVVNTVRVNNAGFVSDVDYEADAPGPLLAVIGDSYVEAVMVPFRQTCAGRLATMLEPAARAYAFGMSGAPLSRYLAWARHAREAYRPGRAAGQRGRQRLRTTLTGAPRVVRAGRPTHGGLRRRRRGRCQSPG